MFIDYLSKRKLEPISRLIKKYNKGTIADDELMTLHEWIGQSQENLELFIDYSSPIKRKDSTAIAKLKDESIKNLMDKINKSRQSGQ